VVVSASSAWELQGEAGLSYLAARSVIEELQPSLTPLGGRASASCNLTEIRFAVSLPAATWEAGAKLFLDAVFGGSISNLAVERARQGILREARLAEASFSTEIRSVLDRVEFGDTDRWARPSCGTAETIASLGSADARRMAQNRFTPYRATAAIAGPVGSVAPMALLGRYLPDSELPVLIPAPTRVSAERTHSVERNTITSWVGVAFPFSRGMDREALRLLAFLLEREVSPAPRRPEIYDASVEIEQHGAGGALIVYLVTAPTQARRWADRVVAIARATAQAELAEPVFDAIRRRFTGQRLLELESPEARAQDAALQLFFEHGFVQPSQRIMALTPGDLQGAATALGPPVTALLGPR
jgi:predicted Zn-dependent peptidase